MTLEAVAPMERAEAQRVTERIRLKLDSAANVLDSLGALVADAYQRRADLAMGYDSWSAYADAEFAAQTANLAAPIRRELVGRLTEAGMSTRAIAPAVGVSHMQVSNDRKAGVKDVYTSAPDPLAEEKADGRVVKLTGPGSLLHSEPVERIDMETGEVLTEPLKVTGLDGKTYTRPMGHEKPSETAARVIADAAPAKSQRRPITDAFWQSAYDMAKQADALRRLVDDERFTRNREALAQKNQHEIQRAISTLSEVLTALQPNIYKEV